MKKLALLALLTLPLVALAQNKKPPTTLRGVLLEELHTTHDQEDWFVPASVAIDGLTAFRRPTGLPPVVLEHARTSGFQGRKKGAV